MEVGASVTIYGHRATVKYVGEYHVKPGIWVGLELAKPKGKNNGMVSGKQYFTCPDRHGLFVTMADAMKVAKIVEAEKGVELKGNSLEQKEEVKEKCRVVERKIAQLRKRAKQMREELATRETGFAQKLQECRQRNEDAILNAQLAHETEMVTLMDRYQRSVTRRRELIQSMDDRNAKEMIGVLREVDSEHRKYHDEFEKFITAQRLNYNAVTMAVRTLKRRTEKLRDVQRKKDKEIEEKCRLVEKYEAELAAKRPEWRKVSELRSEYQMVQETWRSLSERIEAQRAEAVQMNTFFGLFNVPFINCMAAFARIRAKLDVFNNMDKAKYEYLHVCDTADIVFCRLIKFDALTTELSGSLEEVEVMMNKGQLPSLDSVNLALRNVSSESLECCISSHFIRAAEMGIEDEAIIAKVEELAVTMRQPMHPCQMKEEGETFSTWVIDLKQALLDAAKGEKADMGLFTDTLPTFIDNLKPDLPVSDGFFGRYHDRKLAKSLEIRRARYEGEKAELTEQVEILESEFQERKAEMERLKSTRTDGL